MIVLLYLVLLVIFLVLLKNMFFSKEDFHPEYIQTHTHHSPTTSSSDTSATTQSLGQTAVNNIPNNEDEEQRQTTQAQQEPTVQVTTTVFSSSTTQSQNTPEPHDPSSENNVREINQESENGESNRVPEITPDELRSLEQNRTAEEDAEIRRVTAQVDDKCCGVNIFEKKLQNINKCIEQHIKNTGNRVNPIYNEWKEIDEEENTCQSPQHVLAKTSNCYDIVNEYKDNINSLLCISNQNTEGCSYNSKSKEVPEGAQLSDNDKFAIFIGNISRENRGTPVRDEYPKGSYYYIKKYN